jgi:hypothetical protein
MTNQFLIRRVLTNLDIFISFYLELALGGQVSKIRSAWNPILEKIDTCCRYTKSYALFVNIA